MQILNDIKLLHPLIQEVAEGSFRHKQPPAIEGSGWVVKSLEAALWAFHAADSFEEAVLRAVNLGDDADTTGAICGQLAGACWGETNIPEPLRSGLARMDMIEEALAGIVGALIELVQFIAQVSESFLLTSLSDRHEKPVFRPPIPHAVSLRIVNVLLQRVTVDRFIALPFLVVNPMGELVAVVGIAEGVGRRHVRRRSRRRRCRRRRSGGRS